MPVKLFVYGTLRKSGQFHYFLEKSTFIGNAHTKEKFALYLGEYPYVIENEKISSIIGEVYEVDENTLEKIDELEEHPEVYLRKETLVIVNKEEFRSWLYFYPKPDGKLILSGNYLE